MAAPLIVAIPSILAALWSGLVICFKWLVDHLHTVKIAAVAVIMLSCYKMGLVAYSWVVRLVTNDVNSINIQHGATASLEILAKANYVLPLDEALSLLASYIALCGICMSIKWCLAAYKAIPFKSA